MSDTITGTARNAKAGAICMTANGNVHYVGGLREWPDMLDSQPVIVLGRSQAEQYLPVASQDADGAWSQGKTSSALDAVVRGLFLPAPPWRIVHADGSANVTRVSMAPDNAIDFTYEPVLRENSSSGDYSGGEPASGKANLAAAAVVWKALYDVLDANKSHTEARAMGTGQFTITSSAGERSLIVRPSPHLNAFQDALTALTTAS